MNGLLHTIQSMPEKRRHVMMYSILFAAGLVMVSLLGVTISARISDLDSLEPAPESVVAGVDTAAAASPIEGFFGSFGSAKKFFVNDSVINQEKTGLSRITLHAGELFSHVSENMDRGMQYIYQHWMSKRIEN